MAKTTVAQKPTKQARTLTFLASEFARVMRLKVAAEERRRNRIPEVYETFEKAEYEYKEAKTKLEFAIADAPETQDIGNLNKQIEDLKTEAAAAYDPLNGSTFRERDGAGFQFRASSKTVIEDEEALAASLIHNNLWAKVGAELSVSPAKASQVLKTHSLPGLSVVQNVTVAAYGPSNPKEN